MNIRINGYDFTPLLGKCTVKPFFERIQGPNGGVSMGGTTILDTVAIKNGFELTAGLMTQEEYSKLLFYLQQDYISVSYDDPNTTEPVICVMTTEPGQATQITTLTGKKMYKNMDIKFREK